MVISYEIYEISRLRVSYEMTMNVRFCLLYNSSKKGFITAKLNFLSIRKCTVDTDNVNDIMRMHQSVISHVVIPFL